MSVRAPACERPIYVGPARALAVAVNGECGPDTSTDTITSSSSNVHERSEALFSVATCWANAHAVDDSGGVLVTVENSRVVLADENSGDAFTVDDIGAAFSRPGSGTAFPGSAFIGAVAAMAWSPSVIVACSA